MGVQGLTRFVQRWIEENGLSMPKRTLRRGNRLIVDGPALAWYFLDLLPEIRRDHRGGYREIHDRTTRFVNKCRNAGVDLVVFWDGPNTIMKEWTKKKRRGNREIAEDKLMSFALDGKRGRQNEYPPPPLFTHQVRSTLMSLKVHQIQCKFEADPIIALCACNACSTGLNAYVAGRDSDFIVFRDVQYIPLDSIVFRDLSRGLSIGAGILIEANVLSRHWLASLLNVPDMFIVEFACFLGNDFTKSFFEDKAGRALRTSLLADNDKGDAVSPESDDSAEEFGRVGRIFHQLKRSLLYEEGDASLKSTVKCRRIISPTEREDFRRALTFSREFYDMRLEKFDAYDFDDDRDDDDEDRAAMTSAAENDRNICAAFTDVIVRMHEILRSETRADVVTLTAGLRCCDLQVAEAYQRIFARRCGALWQDEVRKTSQKSSIRGIDFVVPSSSCATLPSPMLYFDGPLFHHLMLKMHPHANSNFMTTEDADCATKSEGPVVLPIDAHRETIVKHIRENRVTIIRGETGCGKSSRVPLMILEDSKQRDVTPFIFVTQPRRLAATALYKRISSSRNTSSDVGLRLGQGQRDGSWKKGPIVFCTAGYLQMLVGGDSDSLARCSHLVIDEVHERSVDTDLLALFVRRIMRTNTKLKLILMSATLSAEQYRKYFAEFDTRPEIMVGARRFENDVRFLDQLASSQDSAYGHFPELKLRKVQSLSKQLLAKFQDVSVEYPAKDRITQLQVRIAFAIARAVGQYGRSVLIFVDGIGLMDDVVEAFEGCDTSSFELICIHSSIPFEDQMGAFSSKRRQVKIVVATNAAESSVTIPDCDDVICLGLEKRIMYDQKKHRSILCRSWISKASATQRAGRTGRVRKGRVWRLYPSSLHGHMDEFEPPEMEQIPLDQIALRLCTQVDAASRRKCEQSTSSKEAKDDHNTSVEDDVKNMLANVMDPPEDGAVDAAFASLLRRQLIESDGAPTTSGELISRLGIDLDMGQLILYGSRLGCTNEAIAIAAGLSLNRSPFLVATNLFHSHFQILDIMSKVLRGHEHFDIRTLRSYPLVLLELQSRDVTERSRSYYSRYGLKEARVRLMRRNREHLMRRFSQVTRQELVDDLRSPTKHPDVALMLRLAMFWAFESKRVKVGTKHAFDADRDHFCNLLFLPHDDTSGPATADEIEALFKISKKDEHHYEIVPPQTVNTFSVIVRDRQSLNHILEAIKSISVAGESADQGPCVYAIVRMNGSISIRIARHCCFSAERVVEKIYEKETSRTSEPMDGHHRYGHYFTNKCEKRHRRGLQNLLRMCRFYHASFVEVVEKRNSVLVKAYAFPAVGEDFVTERLGKIFTRRSDKDPSTVLRFSMHGRPIVPLNAKLIIAMADIDRRPLNDHGRILPGFVGNVGRTTSRGSHIDKDDKKKRTRAFSVALLDHNVFKLNVLFNGKSAFFGSDSPFRVMGHTAGSGKYIDGVVADALECGDVDRPTVVCGGATLFPSMEWVSKAEMCFRPPDTAPIFEKAMWPWDDIEVTSDEEENVSSKFDRVRALLVGDIFCHSEELQSLILELFDICERDNEVGKDMEEKDKTSADHLVTNSTKESTAHGSSSVREAASMCSAVENAASKAATTVIKTKKKKKKKKKKKVCAADKTSPQSADVLKTAVDEKVESAMHQRQLPDEVESAIRRGKFVIGTRYSTGKILVKCSIHPQNVAQLEAVLRDHPMFHPMDPSSKKRHMFVIPGMVDRLETALVSVPKGSCVSSNELVKTVAPSAGSDPTLRFVEKFIRDTLFQDPRFKKCKAASRRSETLIMKRI